MYWLYTLDKHKNPLLLFGPFYFINKMRLVKYVILCTGVLAFD
jgi:hypothetical protein